MVTHANCLPVGTVIADFEVIGLVGEGGFGIVYLARDVHLDRVVAVKEYMPSAFAGRIDSTQVAVRAPNHQPTYEAGLRSFINEARMLARFSHPSLVEVYRFWEGNGTAYVAMRYYEGDTLRQHLARGDMVFDEATIAQTMSPVFDALEMLHREQVFHRDIAPDNIILSGGHSVLLDFGSARRIIGDGIQALTTVLKPGYAPIEQYVDDGTMKQGPWTDVYALGGVLYHLATGKAPLQAVSRLMTDPLQPVHALMGDRFSMVFSNAVSKAMAVRLEDRLQNVSELREMLGWSGGQSARVVTLPAATYAPTKAERADPGLRPDTQVIEQVAAADQPTAWIQPPAPATPTATPSDSGAAALDPPMRGERPANLPEADTSNHIKLALFAAGICIIIVVAYFLLRPAVPVGAPVAPTPVAPTPVRQPVSSEKPPTAPASASVSNPPPLASAASAAVTQTGIIKLNIRPWGTVVVDGITRGISNETQLQQIELTVGPHTIEIAKPDAPKLVKTVEVSAGSPLTISHTFR